MAKKIYGSVNGAREEAKLAYGSLNGARVRAVKIYGSENGVCKQVYECPYGYISNISGGAVDWASTSSPKDFHDMLVSYAPTCIGKNITLAMKVGTLSSFTDPDGVKYVFPNDYPPATFFNAAPTTPIVGVTFDLTWYRN